jgi:hypothetical protein
MKWDRSETIGLSKPHCVICNGKGLKQNVNKRAPCNCVLRAIFRACYARFRYCVGKEKFMSSASLVPCMGKESQRSYGRVDEEYIADFCLVSRRYLSPSDYILFRNHFLLRADWRLCCRQMKLDRGDFFHAVYRIQQILGKVFRELRPYSLFPIDEYFAGKIQSPNVVTMPRPNRPRPVQPPLKKIA